MASRQANGTLVAHPLVAATLSSMPLSDSAAAILESTTKLLWGAVIVVCSPGLLTLWLLLALWLLLLTLWLLLLLLLLLPWRGLREVRLGVI